jgi:hypothetical protein
VAFELYTQVSLAKDFPDESLKKGDIATLVEKHEVPNNETGYSLEIFNAIGDTIAVIAVSESDIEPLDENEILSVRRISII